MKKYILFFLVVFTIACNKKPPAKKVPLSAKEKLQRAKQLEKWGFKEVAEQHYQKLSTSANPASVRIKALQRLIKIVPKNSKIIFQEQMLKMFPKQPDLKEDLFKHYYSTWQWQKAIALAINSKKIQRIKKILPQWQQRPLVWEEEFSSSLSDWALAHPSFFYRDTWKRYLNAEIYTGTWYYGGKAFHWDGGSSKLSFDINIKDIKWSGEITFGIFRASGLRGTLLAHFVCWGGSGSLYHGVHFQRSFEYPTATMLNFYETNTWYRVVIDYRKEIRQAQMSLYKRESDTKIGQKRITVKKGYLPGPENYIVGFFVNPTKTRRYPSKVVVDNIKLYGSVWSKPKGKLPLNSIHKINLIARKDPILALQQYDSLLAKEPDNWQILEMRSELLLHQRKLKQYFSDVREILRLHPEHPNRDYFLKILKKEKK